MIARNIKTGNIYEGCKTFISSVIGVHRNTITRWEKKNKGVELYNNFEVRFEDVIRK